MSRQDLFERILESLHACVFDDDRWPATSGLIDEFCGATGNFLVFGDGASPDDIDIFFARCCFRGQRDTELEQEYFRVYHAVDERLPRLRMLPDSRVTPVTQLFSEYEKKTSVVYNELLPRTGTRDGLNVRLDGPDGSRIVLVTADPAGGGGWSAAQVETIQRLLPHLRQFVRVRQALVTAGALGASAVELLDNVRAGVIQLDRRARIVAANDRARAILRQGDVLTDPHGTLRASLPQENAALQRLLADVLPYLGGPGAGGSMMVGHEHSVAGLALHVSPVNEAVPTLRQSRVGALVLVVDLRSRALLDADRVGSLLGLTPAESHVAVALAEGKTIGGIAAETGRSPTTIRWHLRHIFDKLCLSRQADLVPLVLSLAAVPGVRR